MTEITIGRNDKTVRIPCFRGLGGCGDRPRVEAIAQAIANKTGMTIDWPRIMARGRTFQAEAERRKLVSHDEAFKKMSAKVCPGCDRPIAAMEGSESNFCVHCGMTLYDHCTHCDARKMAFFRFCMVCGTPAGEAAAASG